MKAESIVIAYHHEAVNFSYSRTHSPSGGESQSEPNLMMVVDTFDLLYYVGLSFGFFPVVLI